MTRLIRFIAAVALVGLATFDSTQPIVLAQAPQAAGPQTAGPADGRASANGIYIVQMDDLPAGSYTGGVAGLPATKASRVAASSIRTARR